jgi:hypothetical protein
MRSALFSKNSKERIRILHASDRLTNAKYFVTLSRRGRVLQTDLFTLMRRAAFSASVVPSGASKTGVPCMCDYSLHSVRTRPAKVGERLVTHNFGTGTRGFAAPEDCSVALCLLPGTELAFETHVKYQTTLMFRANTGHTVAIFRQIDKGAPHIHHDALEFPDGEIVLLTRLCEGQKATVLTLPTQPKTAGEVEAQDVAYIG